MFKKFKSWLYAKFLPAWAKDSVYKDNERLRADIEALKAEIERKDAYIAGLETGLRAMRRVAIYNNGVK